MKKITIVLLLALATCLSAIAGIKVGQNGEYVEASSINNACAIVRNHQMADTIVLGDTIFLSDTIIVGDGANTFAIKGNNGADSWKYTIVGEGIDQTVVMAISDSAYAAGGFSQTNLFFYLTGNVAEGTGPIFEMRDFTIKNYRNATAKSVVACNAMSSGMFDNIRITQCNVGNGSAILAQNPKSLTVKNCVFDNIIGKGGTSIFTYTNGNAMVGKSIDVDISNNVMHHNIATNNNGGVSVWTGQPESYYNVSITNNVIYGCTAVDRGSAMMLNGENITAKLYNNTLAYNGGSVAQLFLQKNDGQTKGPNVELVNNLIYGGTDAEGARNRDFMIIEELAIDSVTTPEVYDTTVVRRFDYRGVVMNNLIGITDVDMFDLMPTGTVNGNLLNDTINAFAVDLPKMITENGEVIPGNNSAAIDAGIAIPDFTGVYNGTAPDIGAYETDYSSAGLKDFVESDVAISPIPARDFLNIHYSHVVQWQVYSINGQSLKQGRGNVVNVSDLKKGVYLISLSELSGKAISVKQFVK